MSPLTAQTISLLEALPADKAKAVLDYASYLAEKADEEAWDRKFSDSRYSAKLKAMGDQALEDFRQGQTTPLDPDRM